MGAKSRARAQRRAAARSGAASLDPKASGRRCWLAGAALFAVALLVRLFFWQATPDRDWPYSAWYKGDAPVWMEYGRALHTGQTFELGLPIHPPAAGYLVAALWNGRPSGVPWLRFCWALMGALVVVLVYVAALRSFGFAVAAVAGFLCAVSSALMVLGSSANNEVPYLLLVIGSLALFEDVRTRPGGLRLGAWSALNGIACLFRVEHLLYFGLVLVLLAFGWWRRSPSSVRSVAAGTSLSLVMFVLPLVPWHLQAWQAIQRFNEGPRVFERGEDAAIGQVERTLAGLRFSPDAEQKRDELPAFLRRTASVFVAATVAHRGGREVRGEDFRILDDAFGYFPRPLARFPFVSSYGPLNFYLANHASARGGFDRSPLEAPPPLAGGAERYPSFLIQGLPPPDLTFVYPPHLRLFNEGDRLGWQAIREQPARWLALSLRKLRIFWSGAAMGVGGFDLPLGLSGMRRAVDLVVPEGRTAGIWGLAVLGGCVLGVVAGWRRPALHAWLAFLASKVVVTVMFFGYARQGAMVVPVVAVLAALACERWLLPLASRLPSRRVTAAALVVLVLPVVIEGARWISRPVVTIDGRAIGAGDPFPADEHRDQQIRVHGIWQSPR